MLQALEAKRSKKKVERGVDATTGGYFQSLIKHGRESNKAWRGYSATPIFTTPASWYWGAFCFLVQVWFSRAREPTLIVGS